MKGHDGLLKSVAYYLMTMNNTESSYSEIESVSS